MLVTTIHSPCPWIQQHSSMNHHHHVLQPHKQQQQLIRQSSATYSSNNTGNITSSPTPHGYIYIYFHSCTCNIPRNLEKLSLLYPVSVCVYVCGLTSPETSLELELEMMEGGCIIVIIFHGIIRSHTYSTV